MLFAHLDSDRDSEMMQSRGRPEQTWDAVVKKDMKKRGLIEECTQGRGKWREAIHIPTLVKQVYRWR